MRFTIKFKLALAFGLMIVLSAAMSTLAIMKLSSLNSAISVIVDGPAANLRNSGDLATAVLNAIRMEKNVVISTDSQAIQALLNRLKQTGRRLSKLPTKSLSSRKIRLLSTE